MKTVAHAMTREVLAFAPETSLEGAARLLANRHVSGAPVVDPGGRPLGVVTQHDITDPDRGRRSGVGQSLYYRIHSGVVEARNDCGRVAAPGTVADVMTSFVVAVPPDKPLLEAARLLVTDNIHRLVIVEGQRILGIVTTMDLLRAFLPES
jgi:CBS domain-containing protein